MAATIIIGGGVVGLSVAYHLAKRHEEDIVLLERNQLTSGTSWHAAGIVGPLRATPNMTKLAMYASQLFPKLEAETGMPTGYKRTGGYWLAREPERMDELNRIAALGKHLGLTPEIIPQNRLAAQIPYLDVTAHVGAMSVVEDASINPVDLCMAYARSAKKGGVAIHENTEVAEILVNDRKVSGVRLSNGTMIKASKVIVCAGAWSKPLALSGGLALPLQAVEHMYVVTEPIKGLPDPFPVVRDLDTGIYIKGDAGGKLIIGGFEPNAKCWDSFGFEGNRPFLELPEDWEQFTPFMKAALKLLPVLDTAGIQRFMNGPESFTADTRPLIGEAPETDGLFVAAGMNSLGIISSAGIGRMMADWMVDGQAPMDLWEVDIARMDPAAASDGHMNARMEEAVSDQFTMHWPFKQPTSGRGLRKSSLHNKWKEQGAVFGVTGGWERGLWYATNVSERNLPYSVGEQPWQKIAEREAAQMNNGAVLLDLSPFGKFHISGPNALAFVENLTCQSMDRPIGNVTYAPVLNERGGIEADVTVTRVAIDEFRITSGAVLRWKDAARLRRLASQIPVTIEDCTEREVVLGIMGAKARCILSNLSKDGFDAFPYSSSKLVCVDNYLVRATRVSFVGELGWELSVGIDHGSRLFDALIAAGVTPMGHYALDACRIEKGFYHWGHDIGPDITPLEAGLGWTVDWGKDFTGKSALLKQKQEGVSRKLCLFEVADDPLILHDEPIWENGIIVGLTTSGGKGARTGMTLAFGLIDISKEETLEETALRNFEIEVAGKSYRGETLKRVPFDPMGMRMRA